MTKPMMIQPYWSDDLSTWVFDDPAVGLRLEPFVSGAPAIIDVLVQDIPNARDGFRLLFSDAPFPGFQRFLSLIREENGGGRYGLDDSTMEGWLCQMLFKYFTEAPAKLYASVEPSNGIPTREPLPHSPPQ
jgi:hypothetical protein